MKSRNLPEKHQDGGSGKPDSVSRRPQSSPHVWHEDSQCQPTPGVSDISCVARLTQQFVSAADLWVGENYTLMLLKDAHRVSPWRLK
jgi:hypothetical protein